jgi:hypothetical protein
MAENPMMGSIGSLFDELRRSITFILGIYEALDQKLPDFTQELWSDLGKISEQMLIEIEDQAGNILANIDSYSAAAASARMHELAGGWEKETEQLALIVKGISSHHIQLEDPKLHMLLNESFPSSVAAFARIVSFGKEIQPEDLFFE